MLNSTKVVVWPVEKGGARRAALHEMAFDGPCHLAFPQFNQDVHMCGGTKTYRGIEGKRFDRLTRTLFSPWRAH